MFFFIAEFERVAISRKKQEHRRLPFLNILLVPESYRFKGQLQRFHKLSLFDRFRHVENRFDINF